MLGADTPKTRTTSVLGIPRSTAASTFVLRSFEYGFMPRSLAHRSTYTQTAVSPRARPCLGRPSSEPCRVPNKSGRGRAMRPLPRKSVVCLALAVQTPGLGPVVRVDPGKGALGGAVLLLLVLLLDLLPGLAALLVALLDEALGHALAAEAEGQRRRQRHRP